MNQSILYSYLILGIPAMYWLLMIASHLLHVYLKIETDVQTNKVAFNAYIRDRWKVTSLVVAFVQSAILLVIGWDAYVKYAEKHPDIDLSLYIGVAVAFIGYGGSSLWNNLMAFMESKVKKNITND